MKNKIEVLNLNKLIIYTKTDDFEKYAKEIIRVEKNQARIKLAVCIVLIAIGLYSIFVGFLPTVSFEMEFFGLELTVKDGAVGLLLVIFGLIGFKFSDLSYEIHTVSKKE